MWMEKMDCSTWRKPPSPAMTRRLPGISGSRAKNRTMTTLRVGLIFMAILVLRILILILILISISVQLV